MSAFPQPVSGCFDGPVHRYAVRVYYEDTDLSGVVYHANYLKWFERARSDMLRLLGIDQRAAQEAGEGAYAVTEIDIRYRSPARLDDVVTVESQLEELRSASCRMLQIARRDETTLSEARLRVGFVDPSGRPRRQPDAWRAAFARALPETEGNR
ncbi:MAG: YbgC/FadM family acyl-CoA thioesterase [Novosphingobium sp.]|nr:YbgC/FadM family acyl-CoA thioesterase [Novosphingobium sp.]